MSKSKKLTLSHLRERWFELLAMKRFALGREQKIAETNPERATSTYAYILGHFEGEVDVLTQCIDDLDIFISLQKAARRRK